MKNIFALSFLQVKKITPHHAVYKYKWFSDISLEDTEIFISY